MIINFKKNINNILEIFLGFFIGMFIFTAYIKHTISLNYILLLLIIVISISLFMRNKSYFDKEIFQLKKEFLPLFLLIFYIFFLAFFLSDDITKALKEIKGQLIVPLIFLFFGIFIVALNNRLLTKRKIFNILFFTGFSHILIITIISLNTFINNGYLPIRKVYILPVDEVSFLTNLLYAMFLTEIYNRMITNKNTLFASNIILGVIFLIFSFSVYLQGMRWGVITFSATSFIFIIFYLYKSPILFFKKILIFLVLMSVITTALILNIKQDKRWDSIVETIPIAIKSDSLYWVNPSKYPCPKLKNGKCVDMSNYLRLAQQINGYKLIIDFPLGVGYSRYAYENALNKRYNNEAGVFDFPHSGILNLLIGIGIPGILLYIIFLYLIIKRILYSKHSYYKIFTIFFIVAFHTRSFVDMTFMNHNLKVFMLLFGLGIGSSILNKRT